MRIRGGGCCAGKHLSQVEHEVQGAIADSQQRAPADPTTLEVAPSKPIRLVLTEEQAAAAAHAKAAQDLVADAALQATDAEKMRTAPNGYMRDGGPQIEDLLECTDLVDVQYLIALALAGGIVPSWKDVPASARINSSNVWRLRCWDAGDCLPVIVLSYPWLDKEHPDRLGEQLRRLLPVLQAVHGEARRYGTHATAAVLWDFMSLPQGSDRSEAELARFKAGLRGINRWYAHPFTIVLMVTTALPSGAQYTNLRPYVQRGWCYFELRTSSIVKDRDCLWDLSLHKEGKPISFRQCQRRLRAGRPPISSPVKIARELREGVASGDLGFTAAADLEMVVGLYEKGFVNAFSTYSMLADGDAHIWYTHLSWTDEMAPAVVEAIAYAKEHCTPPKRLSLMLREGNRWTTAGWASLQEVASSRFAIK